MPQLVPLWPRLALSVGRGNSRRRIGSKALILQPPSCFKYRAVGVWCLASFARPTHPLTDLNHGSIYVYNTLSCPPRSTNPQTPILQTLQLPSRPQAPPSHREHAPGPKNSPMVEIYRVGKTIWYNQVLRLYVRWGV